MNLIHSCWIIAAGHQFLILYSGGTSKTGFWASLL